MATRLDRHAIVGEIGSTHLRFAVADVDELTMDHYVNFRTADFHSVEQALNAYLKSLSHRPARASLAVAGHVTEDRAHVCRLSWTFTREQLQEALSIPVVNLISDINAVSLSIPLLAQHELVQIGGIAPPHLGPKAVVLVEKDIEAAITIPVGQEWKVICGRAGDISFGAEDEDELRLMESMRPGSGRMTLRGILTSTGLATLHNALRARAGLERSGWNASEIMAAASLEQDPLAIEALKRFAVWLGRFAGDLATACGAVNGVYLVGCLPNDILDFLTNGPFRGSFVAAGGQSGLASNIPLYIVTASNAGLRGAALALP